MKKTFISDGIFSFSFLFCYFFPELENFLLQCLILLFTNASSALLTMLLRCILATVFDIPGENFVDFSVGEMICFSVTIIEGIRGCILMFIDTVALVLKRPRMSQH